MMDVSGTSRLIFSLLSGLPMLFFPATVGLKMVQLGREMNLGQVKILSQFLMKFVNILE
jgi:hypothetical protein